MAAWKTNNDRGARVATNRSPSPSAPPFTWPTRAGVVRCLLIPQPSRIAVRFEGTIDPIEARDPSNYVLVASGRDRQFGTRDDEQVVVLSAGLDPSTQEVILLPARRLNVRDAYLLTIKSAVFGSAHGHDFVAVLGGLGLSRRPHPWLSVPVGGLSALG